MRIAEALWTFRNDLSGLLRETRRPAKRPETRAANKERALVLDSIIDLWDATFACPRCHGRGDCHVETTGYSGQATCPECGGGRCRKFGEKA